MRIIVEHLTMSHIVDLIIVKVGISGDLSLWLPNFLTNCFQRVVVDGCLSDWIDIKSGVPQAGADLGFSKGGAKLGAFI